MRLSDLHTGERGVIVKVMGHGGFRKRIVEMGFIKGKTVEVLLNAPLKDPIKYKVMNYEISLRRQEAEMIEIISESEAREQIPHPFHGALPNDEDVSERCHAIAKSHRRTINVALVGNPNCGKTSLFNLASGAHEHVGNYSGVTVDAKEGFLDFQGYHFRIVDLPGTYSMSAYSPEELFVRRHIIDKTPDVIVNVVDASNLERNLYLTTQLIDMNEKMAVAFNMYDELTDNGCKLDYELLAQLCGVPMTVTNGRTGEGLDRLFHILIGIYEGSDFVEETKDVKDEVMKDFKDWHEEYVPDHKFNAQGNDGLAHPRFFRHIHVNHGPEIERSINAIKELLMKNEQIRHRYSTRFLAIKLLENDPDFKEMVGKLPNGNEILSMQEKEAKRIQDVLNEDSEQAITHAKYAFIDGALKETLTVDKDVTPSNLTHRIDRIVTHKIWGFPIFFLLMYIMFQCTFSLGEYPMMAIDWFIGQLASLVQGWMDEGPLKDMIIDGVIGGVGGVIIFLPNIMILYLFISLMEDSGYMSRAAFIMDKIMHKMGLHGKSFIPLIMGFGCNVPAIMATRIIEDRKSRLVTMLVNPFISCSARLPIFLVLVSAFFPTNGSFVLLCIYSFGILLGVLSALFFSKVIVKGESMPFVMELPPYRLPTIKNVAIHTWEKAVLYLKKMGGIILIASIIIWFLGYFPRPTSPEMTQAEQQENSYIGQIGKAIEPVIEPLGFDWKLGVGLVSGVGAKELVVSTLGVLYTNESNIEDINLANRLPYNKLIAVAYMLFVLIYFPCIATLIAIKNESGYLRWAIFAGVYTTGLAWIVAFLTYQLGSLL